MATRWAPLGRLAVVFALGAVGGTALDHLHVAGGVLAYPDPVLLGHAAWVPVALGLAAALGARLAVLLGRRAIGPRPSWLRLSIDAVLFVGAYGVTAAVPGRTALVAAVLGTAWLARSVGGRDPTWRILHALACATLGIAVEAGLVSAGAFRHRYPDVLGVPAWLPALYACAAPLLADAGELLRPREAARFRSGAGSAT